MLALTWDSRDPAPVLEVRTRADGRWGDWQPVPPLADRPDASSGEGAAVASTELMWTGPSDGVRVRVGGAWPRGLTLVLLQPWAQPGDDAADAETDEPLGRTPAARGSRAGRVPRPDLRGRRQWGAREAWRDGRPHYNHTIKQVHVHHTVNSNRYRRGDVPALIRGMYRYHTRYLGWSDIGYNFLVDRFGRIWTGRAGGASRPVRGAHTLGFNATSAGVAVIGNFELARPSDEVLDASPPSPPGSSSRSAATRWATSGSGRRAATGSGAAGRFGCRPSTATATPTRPPARDATSTTTSRRSGTAPPPSSSATPRCGVVEPPALHGTPALGSTLTADPGTYTPADAALTYVWLRDGRRIPRASGRQYDVRPADVGTRISVRITARKPGLKPVTRRRWTLGADDRPRDRLGGCARATVAAFASPYASRHHPAYAPSRPARWSSRSTSRRAVVRLADGRGVATFGAKRPLPRGRYWVKARYLGDRSHDRDRATTRVRVRA